MDRVVDAMGKAGIKVILGTPTYAIPAWMAHQHPEILADRIPGGMFGGQPVKSAYGIRQNMDTDSPAYRFYAERLIRHIVAHYKDNPTVIGWQLDNETSSYDAANPDVFIGFQHYLEKKFVTPEELEQGLVSELLGREPAHVGRSADARWHDLDGVQAGVDALEPDARDGFSALAGGAGAGVRGAGQFITTDFRRHDEARRERRGGGRLAGYCGRQHLSRHAGSL
jgi:hypothetical protein